MYEIAIVSADTERFREWCRSYTVGYWRETGKVTLEESGMSVVFELENEGDAMRAELTFHGKSALTEPTNDVTPEEAQHIEGSTMFAFEQLISDVVDRPEKTNVTVGKSPAEIRRTKFLTAIDEQLMATEALIKKRDIPTVDRKVYKRGAEPETRATPIRPWQYQQDGVYYVDVRYGTRFVSIVNGKSTIKCGGKLTDVKAKLELLRKVAEEGQLDAALEEAASRSGKTPTETPPEPATTE